MLDKETRLQALREFTDCFYHVWSWKLDRFFNVIRSDCPHESLIRSVFLRDGRRDAMENHMNTSGMPVCCTVSSTLSWVMAFETESGEVTGIYIKGPFFTGSPDAREKPSRYLSMQLTKDVEDTLLEVLKQLPILSASAATRLAQMLHYCVQGETIAPDQIAFYSSQPKRGKASGKVEADQFTKTSGRWNAEQELLEKVRRGDMSVRDVLARMQPSHTVSMTANKDSLDNLRQNIHLLLTLVSRAAVEGGLPQRTSFSLCTQYRKQLNACTSAAELAILSNEMIQDYVSRVHKMKRFASCSSQIRLCCEYIDTHPEEKLTLEMLADKAGYTSYHLSRKFKQEMNCSIIDYIQRSKLERAKYLLVNTQTTVDEISDCLGFGTRSYFTSVFKKHTGQTPSDYRREHGLI